MGNRFSMPELSFVEAPVPLPDIASLVDANGAFTISAPVLGEYAIEVVADGFVKKKMKNTVLDNKEKYVEINLLKAK